jgi:Ca2+/Na+ antiporter
MRKFLHENGLAITTFALFLIFWGLMAVAGFFNYNQQQQEHSQSIISFGSYLTTGHFWEATFENWESEFLQMGLFVLLTAYLYQKGSAESKTEEEHAQEKREEEQEQKEEKTRGNNVQVPSPIRRGGWIKVLYENSLSIALLSLFIFSFIFHAIEGVREYNQQQALLGQPPITAWKFLSTSEFWFQSFQNWQSEFLAVGAMVVLTIFLRQKGSAESKRVGAPTAETGRK